MSKELPKEEFLKVIDNTPLISIDLIVKNSKNEYLLGIRKNKPAQNHWFVPGGRIMKDESKHYYDFMDAALNRIIQSELDYSYYDLLKNNQITFRGVFVHNYDDNCQNVAGVTTQYIVLAYDLLLDINIKNLPNSQHGKYRWFSFNELISDELFDRAIVHDFSKDYFIKKTPYGNFSIPKDKDETFNAGLYQALMAHYLHYDGQMWQRSQLLIAVEGAILTLATFKFVEFYVPLVLLGAGLLVLGIKRVITRDQQNRDVNKEYMDNLALKIGNIEGFLGRPYMRSSVNDARPRGSEILSWVFTVFAVLDFSLAVISFLFQQKVIFISQ